MGRSRERASGRRLVHDRGWAVVSGTGQVVAWSRPPLVGRRAELHLLTDRLTVAQAGRPQAVLVRGPAGIGKTRLASELAKLAAERGVSPVWVRGLDPAGPPLLPLAAELVPELTHEFANDEAYSIELDVLEAIPNVVVAPRQAVVSERAWVYRAQHQDVQARLTLSRLTIEAAQRRPRCLIVDDAHLIDRATADVVVQTVRSASQVGAHEPVPLLVVVLSRGADLPPAVEELRDRPGVEVLTLAGLARLEALDLLHALGVAGDDPRAAEVIRCSEGNPLFLAASARQLLVASPGSPGVSVAHDVTAAIGDELGGLPSDCQEVLADAALWVGDPELAHLAAFRGEPEAVTAAHVAPAVDAGVVELDEGRVHFTHGLRHLAASHRRDQHATAVRHRQLADWLEAMEGSGMQVAVARHLIEAGPEIPALRLATTTVGATHIAADRGQWSDALHIGEAALAALAASPEAGDARTEAGVLVVVARAYLANLDLDGARRMAERARRTCAAVGDQVGWAAAVLLEGRARVLAGGFGDSLPTQLQTDLEAVATRDGLESEIALEAQVTASELAWMQGDAMEAARLAERAHAAAVAAGQDRLAAASLVSRSTASWLTLDLEGSARYLDEATRLARRDADPVAVAVALGRRALVDWVRGEADQADRRAREALSTAEEAGDALERPLPLAVLATRAALGGDLGVAQMRTAEALVVVRASGDTWVVPFLSGPAAHAAAVAGDAAGAAELLDELAQLMGPPLGEQVAGSMRAWVDAVTGQGSEGGEAILALLAGGLLDEVIPGPALGVTSLMASVVDCADEAGAAAPVLAVERLRQADELGQRFGATLPLAVARVRAVAARAAGEWVPAHLLARRAVIEADRCGLPVAGAWARFELARVLLAADRARGARAGSADDPLAPPDDPEALVSAASQTCERLGLAGLAAWAARRPELAGLVDTPASPPDRSQVLVAVDLVVPAARSRDGHRSAYLTVWREMLPALRRLCVDLGGQPADGALLPMGGSGLPIAATGTGAGTAPPAAATTTTGSVDMAAGAGPAAFVVSFGSLDQAVEYALRAMVIARRRGLPAGAALADHTLDDAGRSGPGAGVPSSERTRALATLAAPGELLVAADLLDDLRATSTLVWDPPVQVRLPGQDETVAVAAVRRAGPG